MKLNIKSFSLTSAILWSAAILLVGLANIIWPSYGNAFLQLVASIYPGFHASQSIGDVIVGALYALIDGAIAGLVFAWLYNKFSSKS